VLAAADMPLVGSTTVTATTKSSEPAAMAAVRAGLGLPPASLKAARREAAADGGAALPLVSPMLSLGWRSLLRKRCAVSNTD
jgi:hypothetical protein